MSLKANSATKQASNGISLHERIVRDVQQNIVSGTWPPGHRIPFETDMAKQYGCSRMTVNKALTQLSRAGLLERNKKWGTFVKAPQTLSAALEITNIQKEVEDAGNEYGYQLSHDEIRSVSEPEAKLLDLHEDDEVRELICLHSANGEPFCFEERIVNLLAAPEVRTVDFTQASPGTWMFKQVPWNSAEHQIFAAPSTQEVAKILGIKVGDACLIVERKTQNDKGFVTWAKLYYPGNKHRLVASFTPA